MIGNQHTNAFPVVHIPRKLVEIAGLGSPKDYDIGEIVAVPV
jgi:hypothetical protein